MNKLLIAIASASLTAVASLAIAQSAPLNPAAPGDLTANANLNLQSQALPSATANREEVRFSHVLDNPQPLAVTTSAEKISRFFSMEMTGRELRRGMFIPTQSSAPVIRVIPMHGADKLDLDDLRVRAGGRWMKADDAFQSVVSDAELTAAGMRSAPNSFAMRMKADTRRGFTMRARARFNKDSRYKVMVLEPNSSVALQLRMERNRVVQGQAISANATLLDANNAMAISNVTAFVTAPGATTQQAVNAQLQNGRVTFDMDTSNMVASEPGLWELSLQTRHGRGENAIIRDAKIAFAVAPATASMAGSAEMISDASAGQALALSFPVDVAVAGRYELQAVVFGHNAAGEEVPGVQVMTAKWLDGNGEIMLEVPANQLLEAGIQAPYRIGHLTLKDQTRLSELWSQESAITMP